MPAFECTKVPDAAAAVPLPNDAAEAAAILAAFNQKALERNEEHASNPGAGEGSSRLTVVIDTALPDLIVTETPRKALTILSVVLRAMGIYGATQIGRGHYSEVYSCRDADGRPTGRALKVSKSASSCAAVQPRGCTAARQHGCAAAP